MAQVVAEWVMHMCEGSCEANSHVQGHRHQPDAKIMCLLLEVEDNLRSQFPRSHVKYTRKQLYMLFHTGSTLKKAPYHVIKEPQHRVRGEQG